MQDRAAYAGVKLKDVPFEHVDLVLSVIDDTSISRDSLREAARTHCRQESAEKEALRQLVGALRGEAEASFLGTCEREAFVYAEKVLRGEV